ncbi:MAG TPA: helix-turn-helix domain-containing protein, partial [Kofleriaceae bacterium]|nr:helix-turn-helix domain-containing protein [Kofleriaceae bacterium]
LGTDPGRILAPLAGTMAAALGARGDDEAFAPELSFRAHKEQWNERFERRYVTWLLQRAGGNVSKAARQADMDRKYLHKLIKKYAIDPSD